MPVETELYDILGVLPTATPKEIKKAYHKMALKHHPDKGGDVEKFKKADAAYKILIDPQKKATYDKFGKNGLKTSGAVPEDIFSSIFGDLFGSGFGGGLGNMFKMYQDVRNTIRKNPPVIHKYQVTLEDLCTRKVVKLRFVRERLCPCQTDETAKTCVTCNGRGFRVQSRQIGPNMIQQMRSTCNTCEGKGKIFDSCANCKNGLRKLPKTFHLHLTPELENGYKYTFQNEGNQSYGYQVGDFIVVIVYKKHAVFEAIDKNLYCKRQISLKDALCGYNISVNHPSGETFTVKETGVTNFNTVKKIEGKGMDHKHRLEIHFDIVFPDTLNSRQITSLQKTL
jgi:DnaJ family protein A protein 2